MRQQVSAWDQGKGRRPEHNLQGTASVPICSLFLSPAATGLFNYQVKGSRISAEGLSILYCVSVLRAYDGFCKRHGDIPELTK